MCSLDSIVTLGICPDNGTSTSGLTLLDAAGISSKNLADIANEDNVTGISLALEKKALSIVQVRNDFIGALNTNNVIADVNHPVYDTAFFLPDVNVGTNSSRGIWLHKAGRYRGSLRKTYIKAIQLYPLSDGTGTLTIWDGIHEYAYAVNLVGGQVNTFDVDSLDGFPFEINTNSASVKVLITSSVSFASSKITCKTGCNGTMPNQCGWAEGWNGSARVREEGHGMNVQFYCECDYEQILCNLSKGYSGELIWWKWQANIFREHQKSNRFTNWVIYNHEEMQKWIDDAESNYNRVWNNLMAGMLGILKSYNDDCLSCKRTRWLTNI